LRGQDRYACSNHVMNGSCTNSRSITREALEARMLEGLRVRLMAPEIAAEAMRAYAEETNRLNRDRRSSGDADRKALADVEKKLKEIVAAIEDGGYSRPLMGRLRELEAKQDELSERLSRTPVDIPDIHPNVGGIYRRKVERLAEALQHPKERDEAAEAIRALIDRITLTPGAKRGEIAAILRGDLGTILEWVAQKQNTPGAFASGVLVSVVAGSRNQLGEAHCFQGLQAVTDDVPEDVVRHTFVIMAKDIANARNLAPQDTGAAGLQFVGPAAARLRDDLNSAFNQPKSADVGLKCLQRHGHHLRADQLNRLHYVAQAGHRRSCH